MSEQFSIYRCNECDCMVEIIKPGNDAPSCCGKTMEALQYNTDEAGLKSTASLSSAIAKNTAWSA